ncbi:MAG: hypothetical protein F6K19_12845 [Cyanothece sp. SIO1E1]|nr:hypothetical protein [Cyanothece sp. SIO1E1]
MKQQSATEFKVGDRVQLPSGRTGIVQPAPWKMPRHTLVGFPGSRFPGGLDKQWVLTEVLQVASDSQ